MGLVAVAAWNKTTNPTARVWTNSARKYSTEKKVSWGRGPWASGHDTNWTGPPSWSTLPILLRRHLLDWESNVVPRTRSCLGGPQHTQLLGPLSPFSGVRVCCSRARLEDAHAFVIVSCCLQPEMQEPKIQCLSSTGREEPLSGRWSPSCPCAPAMPHTRASFPRCTILLSSDLLFWCPITFDSGCCRKARGSLSPWHGFTLVFSSLKSRPRRRIEGPRSTRRSGHVPEPA